MNVLTIALQTLRLTFRQKEGVFWIFVGPMIFTVFFGLLMKPEPPRPPSLTIVNLDRDGRLASDLASLLEHDGVVVHVEPTTPVEPALSGPAISFLVIPAGAADAIAAGKKPDLVLHAGAEETSAERNLRFKIMKAYVGSLLGTKPTDAPGPLAMVPADIGVKARPMTAGFQRSVPSYTVMFVFLNLLVSGVGIAEERRRGLLRRLGMAPITKGEIVWGKLLGRVIVGWVQIAWMLLVGRYVFKIAWAEHGWLLFAFLSLFALASAALGILFGTIFRDPDKCRTFAIWTAILVAPLGGLWWPIEVVGPTMRRISYFVPTGWAMEPVNAMLAFGAGPREVAPFALALAAMFVVTFWIAARRLDPA